MSGDIFDRPNWRDATGIEVEGRDTAEHLTTYNAVPVRSRRGPGEFHIQPQGQRSWSRSEWEWGKKSGGRPQQPGSHSQDVGLSSECVGGPEGSEQGSNQICLGL